MHNSKKFTKGGKIRMKVLCEYLENPLGMDNNHPRFTWIVEDYENGEKQSTYHIKVSKSQEMKDLVWDSGVVSSQETVNVIYQGYPLETAMCYYYQVEVTANTGRSIKSEIQTFHTGIMEGEWDEDFIGGSLMERHTFWFRHVFEVKKKVASAIVYLATPNYYVFTVNGKQTTDSVLNNAWTDPEKTLIYGTYVITDLLQQGENVFGVEVGNGWNAIDLGHQEYGVGEHLFSVKAIITYEDGTKETVTTNNKDWFFSVDGPMTLNSIYAGEDYDARKELTGWDAPGYDMDKVTATWQDALEYEPPCGKIKSQMLELIKVVEHITPVETYALEDGSYVFDMGQNFAGWAKLKVEAPEGTEISMIYSEAAHEDHTLNRLSIRGARATDKYICKGKGTEYYEPRFTYHGFRYVRVTGLTKAPDKDTIIGCFVRSSVEKTGEFSCSNPIINKVQENIQRTEGSNLHGVPTDCPQRDERLGWLNDMTMRNECALYNYRLTALYEKWLNDIRDTQGTKTGAITDTAPFRKFGQRPADPVSGSFIMIPWNLYRHYQDTQVIEDNYEAMKKWAGYLVDNSRDGIVKYSPMGDWAAPIGDGDADTYGSGALSKVTPTRQMGTGFLYYDLVLMSRMAEIIGKEEDSKTFSKQAEVIKEAFNREYYHPDKKYYAINSQASNVLPLYLGLVPEEDRKAVLENLVKDIVEKNDTHLTTGNLCTRLAIEVLFQEGYEDIAYTLLSQTTYPSWGYTIINGATSIWERWEKAEPDSPIAGMASLNHPMNGSAGITYFKYLAGISPEDNKPGFRKVKIKPVIPAGLDQAKAVMNTIRGQVVSEWDKTEDGLKMTVQIPFNCEGDVWIPVPDEGKTAEIKVNGEPVSYNSENVTDHKYYRMAVESGKYVVEIKNEI